MWLPGILAAGLGLEPDAPKPERPWRRAALQDADLPKPDADGWISLFNGKDLSGWDGDPAIWRVENSYISGKAEKVAGNSFLIYKHEFADFVLEAKWILIKTGKFPNSGIQFRSVVANPKKWIVHGYQADIGPGYTGNLYDEGGKRGTIFKSSPEAAKSEKDDDWNLYEIACRGSKIRQVLNGKVAGEFDDKDDKQRRLKGIIALQYHSPGAFEIKFKDVRIKLLPKEE